jgi:hypothetical protein
LTIEQRDKRPEERQPPGTRIHAFAFFVASPFIHMHELRWENHTFVSGSLDLSRASGYLPASTGIKIPISQFHGKA